MYVPKKLKWETLGNFKRFLETETTEKVVVYNGYQLITETTVYGMIDSQLNCRPIPEKKPVPKQEPIVRRKVPVSETPAKKTSKIKKNEPVSEDKTRQQVLEEMKERGKKAIAAKKKVKTKPKSKKK